MNEPSDKETDVTDAVRRAVATGERVPIMADGAVVGYVSAPNRPLRPGPCCEEHAADERARIVDRLRRAAEGWRGRGMDGIAYAIEGEIRELEETTVTSETTRPDGCTCVSDVPGAHHEDGCPWALILAERGRCSRLEREAQHWRGETLGLAALVVRAVCGLGDEPMDAREVDRLAEHLRVGALLAKDGKFRRDGPDMVRPRAPSEDEMRFPREGESDADRRLRDRITALENALRACCEAVETEKTCHECGGVTSFTDGDEDGVVGRHRDDCEFGAARRLLEGASPGRVAELESVLAYHRKTICSCDDGHVCRVCRLLDGERP